MKFNQRLQAHLTSEWRKQYVDYAKLKEMIYSAQDESPVVGDVHADSEYFLEKEGEYMEVVQSEVSKIEAFFCARETLAQSTFASLKEEVQKLKKLQPHSSLATTRSLSITRREVAHSWAREVKVGMKGGEKETKRVRKVVKRHEEVAVLSKKDIQSRLNALKLAFTEFYLSLILMQQFQDLNREGLRKILKKHDKEWKTGRGLTFYRAKVLTNYFVTSKEVDQLILDVENMFIDDLEGGERRKAMNRLRVPPLESRISHWSTFALGLNIGMSTILIILVIIWGAVVTNSSLPNCGNQTHPMSCDGVNSSNIVGERPYGWGDWVSAVPMFRLPLFLGVMIFLIGVNTYGWRAAGVNHVLIFEINPRDHLSAFQLMGIGSFVCVWWLVSLLGFFVTHHYWSEKYAFLWPVAATGILVLYTLNPFKVFQYSSRKWFLGIMRRVVFAPAYPVAFPDFWIADQWTSLGGVLLDAEFTVCFFIFDWGVSPSNQVCTSVRYGIRPIIAILPSWFRFAQCLRRYRDTRKAFPHLVNAGKYSTGIFEVLFSSLYHQYKENDGEPQMGAYFGLWIVSFIAVFGYKLWWDLYMDWGLMEKKNSFLREELIYGHKLLYYVAIVEDTVLRSLWTLRVSLVEAKTFNGEVLKTIFSFMELVRRFVWNFFRLENEHLNNCGEFRATRDISIKPLHEISREKRTVFAGEAKGNSVADGRRASSHPAYVVTAV